MSLLKDTRMLNSFCESFDKTKAVCNAVSHHYYIVVLKIRIFEHVFLKHLKVHSRRQVKAEGYQPFSLFLNLELVLEFALGDSPGLKWQAVAISFITV